MGKVTTLEQLMEELHQYLSYSEETGTHSNAATLHKMLEDIYDAYEAEQ